MMAIGALFGLLLGAATAYDPVIAIGLMALAVGVAALGAPTAAWVGGAVAAVLLIRVPIEFGLLPEVAVQLPIVIGWVALGLGLVRSGRLRGLGGNVVALLGALGLVIIAAALAADSEILRPAYYLSLVGTPFALLAALLLDPPDPRWRRRLLCLLLGLVAIQVPFVLAQTALYGSGDPVRGTLLGSDIGAHQIGAVAVVTTIWLILSRPRGPAGLLAVLLLAMIPFLTAANQVIFALPIALVATAALSRGPLRGPALPALGLMLLVLLLLPGWNSDYARQSLGKLGNAVKAEPASALVEDVSESPQIALVGEGPAETVSGAAVFTIDENGVVGSIGLEPAEFPQEMKTLDEPGSIQRPTSSLLGLAGDLGIAGLVAFGLLFGYVYNRIRKYADPLGQAATTGLGILLVLGYFNDAFEQPPFAFFLMVMTGLTLTRSRSGDNAR